MRSHKTQTAPVQTGATKQALPAEPASKPASPQSDSAPPASSSPAVLPVTPAATASSTGDVVSRSIPDVQQRASDTIHGTVAVVVRVSVDATGSVTDADFATHGPSAYFARLALDSARNWKFKPPQQDGRACPARGCSTTLSAAMRKRETRRDNPVEECRIAESDFRGSGPACNPERSRRGAMGTWG